MSIHPSLSSSDKHKRHKSVLKRIERIKDLLSKDKWKESDSLFGLPKTKIVKIKIKKEKAPEAVAAAAEGAAAGAAQTPAGGPEKTAAKEQIVSSQGKEKQQQKEERKSQEKK